MKSLSPRERKMLFVVLPVSILLLAIGYYFLLSGPEAPAHADSHSHPHHPHSESSEDHIHSNPQ